MANTIWFDMDGTLYDLYKIPDWLPRLREEDSTVYCEDMPRHNWQRINNAIQALADSGWKVGIITWAAKDVTWTDEFFIETRDAKWNWTGCYFPALVDGCFACIPYGYSKAQFLQEMGGDGQLNILVDDNKIVREDWRSFGKNYKTINASRSFVRELEGLLG